jgi:hypothetical protein
VFIFSSNYQLYKPSFSDQPRHQAQLADHEYHCSSLLVVAGDWCLQWTQQVCITVVAKCCHYCLKTGQVDEHVCVCLWKLTYSRCIFPGRQVIQVIRYLSGNEKYCNYLCCGGVGGDDSGTECLIVARFVIPQRWQRVRGTCQYGRYAIKLYVDTPKQSTTHPQVRGHTGIYIHACINTPFLIHTCKFLPYFLFYMHNPPLTSSSICILTSMPFLCLRIMLSFPLDQPLLFESKRLLLLMHHSLRPEKVTESHATGLYNNANDRCH